MPARQPRNLPFVSLGSLFVGREATLDALRAALTADKKLAVAGRALHGLGGIGKTRLAIEYAWRHADEHSALLFVSAEHAAALNANLAALAGAESSSCPRRRRARTRRRSRRFCASWKPIRPGFLFSTTWTMRPLATQ